MITKDTQVIGVPPRISPAKFAQVLKDAKSPAAATDEMIEDAYAYVVGAGVDPCFILAIYRNESQFGTDPKSMTVIHDLKNVGNCRSSSIGPREIVPTEKGLFVRYNNYPEAWLDAANRLTDLSFPYAQEGRKTIEQVIEKWAPSSENDTQRYINNVVQFMSEWIGEEGSNMAPNYDYYTLNIIDKTSQLVYNGKTGSRGGYTIKEVILHETAGPRDVKNATGSQAQALDNATLNWFLKTPNQLSIHYFLGGENNGAPVYRCCPESVMAYHAIGNKGVAAGGSVENHISIGIERMGQPNDGPVGPLQTAALCKLVLDICKRDHLTADDIYAHADVQSDKQDGRTIKDVVKAYVRDNLEVDTVSSINQPPRPAVGQLNGKTLGGGFKLFYDKLAAVSPNFELIDLGLPLTNEFDCDLNGDGKLTTVQLFERGLLVYDKINAAPWDITRGTIRQIELAIQTAKAKGSIV